MMRVYEKEQCREDANVCVRKIMMMMPKEDETG